MGGPFTPEDVIKAKSVEIPEKVFDAFNAELVAHFSNGRVRIDQQDIVKRLVDSGMDKGEIFASGWLNVEEVYRLRGWKVTYHKPDYHEPGEPYFEFETC